MEHGLQRYRCVGCGRTFNALTGTPLARLRKKECWASFANSLQQSHSVREAARQIGVAKNTSFRWRHRFLRLDKDTLKQKLTGIVEVDESFVLESRKGERGLAREARKRGGRAQKPGLSDEQTPVLIARDRHGDQVDAVLPNRTAEAVGVALDGVLAKDDVLLCVDWRHGRHRLCEKARHRVRNHHCQQSLLPGGFFFKALFFLFDVPITAAIDRRLDFAPARVDHGKS